MALLPKKTYSRRNNDCSLIAKEKENVDPFDELLSSPLKQNVQFKPLSFWDGKVKDVETNKKSKNLKWELYKTSDSEDNSPNKRKKNSRAKYSKCKGNSLSLRNKNQNTSNAFSIVRSCTRKSKCTRAPSTFKNSTLMLSDDEFGKHRSHSLDNTLDFSKSPNPMFISLHENCDEFKHSSAREKTSKRNCLIEHGKGLKGTPYPLRIKKKDDKKGTHRSQIELKNKTIINGGLSPRVTTAKENLEALSDKTLMQNNSEEPENLTLHINKTMEGTSLPNHISNDYFGFVTVRRYLNNFSENNNTYAHSSVDLKLESLNNSQNTVKEINGPEDLTFVVCEEINIPGKNLENINKDITTNIAVDDLVTNANLSFYNDDSGTIVTILSSTAYEGDVQTSSVYSDDEDLIDNTFCGSETLRKSTTYVEDDTALNEDTLTQSLLEFQTKNSDLDMSSIVFDNDNNSEDFTQELSLGWNENSTGGAESSSASDENPFYLNDEDSVINLLPNKNNTPNTDNNAGKESPQLDSSSKKLSRLTTEISNLTISDAVESGKLSPEPKAEDTQVQENNIDYEGTKSTPVVIDLRNVTTKRKYYLANNSQRNFKGDEDPLNVKPREDEKRGNSSQGERGYNETLEQSIMANKDKINFDWNKTFSFANPIFESTRLQDVSVDSGKFEKTMNRSQKLEEGQAWLDHSYAFISGKKWLRSVSVLKQIRNGSMGCFESTRIKGRHFESFVKDMLEMQSGKSGWPISMADLSNVSTDSGINKPFPRSVSICYSDFESKDPLRDITFKGSHFSVNCSDGSVLETSLTNPTIKLIHPEEKPSGFGLKVSNLALHGENLNESNGLSARDFILCQCGQNDVLPFEEYFNERTLKDCKKIGEGVYGEVFSSGDTVIKIIPIEGSEKVNGEPQKTFEEIVSEVVIALKLSNLRKGKKNRTNGFSEVKRCWCVKGKYPEYLLRLWNEYDQKGNGSENDSPVMFKDDQLYIILELANGGKDLESYVFSSASQSLSIFFQAAFSLAVAEKALEFEHRDLHWGNVLITETKDKYFTVVLQNVEYKIPSKGVKVCIIDFTLSRMYHEGLCVFNDLSIDPSLFTSVGDYQFEIYRMMLKEVKNDWSLFRPKTNIFWLHYMLDKMITMVRYKNRKAKLHKKGESDLKILKAIALDFKETTDFVLNDSFSDLMERQ